jgi:Family of unknown function (DUF5641)
MATKAIHLELVTGLTTEAYLAALRRFTARRGYCKDVYSDNGTNFVGAQRALAKEFQNAIQIASEHAAETLVNDGIKWRFIPPRSPHFGGLWEAAVKSGKNHLKPKLYEKLLSYEELTTILCRIEACLNSRLLSQLSSDPNDLNALIPGHFLSQSQTISHYTRDGTFWMEQFWNRWQEDYLSSRVFRGKWNIKKPNLKVGELVLIRDKNISP